LRKKAAQQGLESRIVTHKSDPDRIGISEKVDFALAFYMVHEVPNAEAFLMEIVSLLKPKGKLLVVEPKLHVSATAFEKTTEVAEKAGLSPSLSKRSASVEVSYFNWAEDESTKLGRQEDGKGSRIGLQSRGNCNRY